MVRIGIIGDVHIHLLKDTKSYEYTEDLNRLIKLFDIIKSNNYDYVVFLGDLFDRARPSLEEIALATELMKGLNNVIIVDGNHEAVTKTTSTFEYISVPNTMYKTYETITIEGTTIRLLGYKNIQKYAVQPSANILLSHLRCNLGAFIKEEIPLDVLAKRYDTVILGDIHDAISPLDNVHYTSSPYSLHYGNGKSKHGFIELVIDNDKHSFSRVELNLPSKRKLSVTYAELKQIDFSSNVDRLLIEVKGTLEELQDLPKIPLVRFRPYITRNIQVTTEVTKKVDLLDSLHSMISDAKDTGILEKIYKDIT